MSYIDRMELEALADRLQYKFNNLDLLEQALIHRSFLNEKQAVNAASNERFEFLGDAALSVVISHMLIEKFPDADEGRLSKFRARLVNENTLARLANDIDLGRFIRLGRGEEQTGGREKSSILSDAYEAVTAAVYLDGGFQEVFSFVSRQFASLVQEASIVEVARDYKTELQEKTQSMFRVIPRYRMLSETGPEHDKVFEIAVTINGKIFGTGRGRTKKEAEQKAAMESLFSLMAGFK